MNITEPVPPDTEVRRLLHELQVHQVELAQQNEELRAARAALEASLQRQVALFEFAPVGLLSVDAAGRIFRCNRRAADLLGPQAQPGRPLAELVAPASRDVLLRLLSEPQAAPGGEVGLDELQERTAAVQVCRPAPGDDELLVALADSTEIHRAERARLAQEHAETASREKSTFLARMSHELRTPLNAVLGFAHLLAREPTVAASAQVAERVGRIADAGRHLLALVDEVLDLSRLEAGSLALLPEDFDLVPVLHDVVAMLSPLAAQQPVTMHLSGADGAMHVHADRARTRQVLTNLVSNAIKYNRRGGTVHLRVLADADEVAVAVTDSGLGLTAEQCASLFVPFNRIGAERTAVAGVGLGLAIARQFVQAMQGRLEVTSTPGEGSTFTMTLPRSDRTSVQRRAAETAVPAGHGPLCVVCVEDNPVNAEVLLALLQERPQLRALVAEDGSSGLALVQAADPDLVLLDMQLPDMEGLEFLARLRSDPATASIPCVAVSANAMAQDVSAALAAGLAGYLTKPVDVDALMALLDRTPPRQRAGTISRC